MKDRMRVPSPLRAAVDALAEKRGVALERMVIYRQGNEAWFTIKDDTNFYYAVGSMREGQPAVDISPQRPSPQISKRLGRETSSPE